MRKFYLVSFLFLISASSFAGSIGLTHAIISGAVGQGEGKPVASEPDLSIDRWLMLAKVGELRMKQLRVKYMFENLPAAERANEDFISMKELVDATESKLQEWETKLSAGANLTQETLAALQPEIDAIQVKADDLFSDKNMKDLQKVSPMGAFSSPIGLLRSPPTFQDQKLYEKAATASVLGRHVKIWQEKWADKPDDSGAIAEKNRIWNRYETIRDQFENAKVPKDISDAKWSLGCWRLELFGVSPGLPLAPGHKQMTSPFSDLPNRRNPLIPLVSPPLTNDLPLSPKVIQTLEKLRGLRNPTPESKLRLKRLEEEISRYRLMME